MRTAIRQQSVSPDSSPSSVSSHSPPEKSKRHRQRRPPLIPIATLTLSVLLVVLLLFYNGLWTRALGISSVQEQLEQLQLQFLDDKIRGKDILEREGHQEEIGEDGYPSSRRDHQEGDTTATSKERRSVPVNVFHHIYSGESDEKKAVALKIATEQLAEVARASREWSRISGSESKVRWVLRHVTIGAENLDQVVQSICEFYQPETLECQNLGYHAEGQESITLQHMHDYCQDHEDEIVVYLHSKGSYHFDPLNKYWRGPLTEAPMRPSCLEGLLNYGSDTTRVAESNDYHDENAGPAICNTCGLQFYPVWDLFYPGNMFSARCSYVKKLLPLQEFAIRLGVAVNTTESEPDVWLRENMYETFYKVDRSGLLGLGRYSAEHWIGSHPSITPCDMAQGVHRLLPTKLAEQLKSTGAAAAPRGNLAHARFYRFFKRKMKESVAVTGPYGTGRPHDYFLLPGVLYRFYKNYGMFPPQESWIWEYFPAGQNWRRKIDGAVRAALARRTPLNETEIW